MARRNGNKKAMKKRGGDILLRSESKLKDDFITYYDYIDFFYDTYYSAEDRKHRANLKKWNEGDTDEK